MMWNRVAARIKHSPLGMLVMVAAVAVVPIMGAVQPAYADTDSTLYLSPATDQTVTTGDDVTVNIIVDTGDDTINEAQTVFTYSASNFSLVSFTTNTAVFPSIIGPTETSGSIDFSAYTTGTVTGIQTVATVVLQATGTGTSTMSLTPTICASGNNFESCSAAYDSTTSDNDLGSVTDSGNYTVDPVASAPASSGSSKSSTSLKTPDTGLALVAAHPTETAFISTASALALLLIARKLKPAATHQKK
jgi:hypothetical protein